MRDTYIQILRSLFPDAIPISNGISIPEKSENSGETIYINITVSVPRPGYQPKKSSNSNLSTPSPSKNIEISENPLHLRIRSFLAEKSPQRLTASEISTNLPGTSPLSVGRALAALRRASVVDFRVDERGRKIWGLVG